MKERKRITAVIAAVSLSVLMTVPAYAGTWQHLGDQNWQWKYVEDDGSYTTNNWQLIDGKWYHLNADGFLDIGLKKFDDKQYLLMQSGALETNKDYGFASSDENGVWTLKYPVMPKDDDGNSIFMDYCKQYGIDIDTIIHSLYESRSYTYTCSYSNFPKDSEGTVVPDIATEAILDSIICYVNTQGTPFNCSYHYSIDSASGTYTITFTGTDGSYIITG